MVVTKEIIVYSDVERNTRITNTEKTLILNELENGSDIDHIHFITFAEENEELNFNNTNIPSLMLKNIAKYIRPIISGNGYSISVQFNKPIIAIDNKKTTQIGSDNQINIYGFQFNNFKRNFRKITTPTKLGTSTLGERLISGTYSLKIDNDYFQQYTYLRARKKLLQIQFHEEEKAVRDIRLITKYVLHLDNHYNNSIYYLYQQLSNKYIAPVLRTNVVANIVKKGMLLFMDNVYPNSLNISENGSIDIVSFFDLSNKDILNIYFLAKLYGENDKRVIKAIENELTKQKIYKREQLQYIKNQKLLYVYYHKSIIANRLFGKAVINLTIDENNILELTYKKNIEYEEFLKSCTCKHINLLKESKHKNSPEWIELKKILSSSTEEMLNCSLCNMPVMCPHAYDKLESENSDNIDYKDNVLRKYAGKAPILDTYYCKICGGVLYKIFMEVSTDFDRKEETLDIFQIFIWKIVKSILNKRVIFTVATGINKLVTSIVDTIIPFIDGINKELRKNKNNTVEIVNDSLVIYIYIYTYALLVRIISHNKNEIRFNITTKKGGDNSTGVNSKELQLLLGKALTIVIQDSDNILKKITNITTNMIKPLFIKAYKDILNTFIIEIETDETLSPEHIINCSEYNIIYLLKKKYNRNLNYIDIKEILNVDLTEIPTLDNVLDKITLPKEIWEKSINVHKSGYYNNKKYIDLNSMYTFLSYMHFLKYSKELIFRTDILTSSKFAEHIIEYNKLKAMENSLQRIQQNRSAIIKHNYRFIRKEREAKITRLSRYYCDNGRKHKFNINIYEKGVSVLYIKTDAMKEWLLNESKNKELSTYKYSDVKCSLCDVLLSSAYDGDNDKSIIKAILDIEEINDFYIYFIDRCPLNNAHKYINNICSKCGITKKMIYTRDITYYKKYVSYFKETTFDRELPLLETIPQPVENKNIQWTIIKTAITDVSSLFNTRINIIENIGLIEGHDYKSIEDGILVPEEKSNRVLSLDTYITSFIIDYEMLRNSNNNPHIEQFAKTWESVDFSKFPDLPTRYHKEKAMYETNTEHKKMSNFILHTLLSYILFIHKHYNSGDEKKAAMEFSLLSLKRIIDNEFKISNHGRYFKTLIEEDYAIDEEIEETVEKDEFNPFDNINMNMDTGIKNFTPNVKVD